MISSLSLSLCVYRQPASGPSCESIDWRWFVLRWRSTSAWIDGSFPSDRLFDPMPTTLEWTCSTTETNACLSHLGIGVTQMSVSCQTKGENNVVQRRASLHTWTTGTGKRHRHRRARLRDISLRSSSPLMGKRWISPKRRCTMPERTNASLKTAWVTSVVRLNWLFKDAVLIGLSSSPSRAI